MLVHALVHRRREREREARLRKSTRTARKSAVRLQLQLPVPGRIQRRSTKPAKDLAPRVPIFFPAGLGAPISGGAGLGGLGPLQGRRWSPQTPVPPGKSSTLAALTANHGSRHHTIVVSISAGSLGGDLPGRKPIARPSTHEDVPKIPFAPPFCTHRVSCLARSGRNWGCLTGPIRRKRARPSENPPAFTWIGPLPGGQVKTRRGETAKP